MDKKFNTKSSAYKRTELQEMMVSPPMDLSFKKASTMQELTGKVPQIIRTGKVPVRTPKDRFITSTLWLSHNSLTSMDGFEDLVNKVLDSPIYLSWLDLSFNQIHEIGDDIAQFPNLKILYLHGNCISNINEIMKLRKLPSIKTLTLHGNPVEAFGYYRGFIVHVLPQLSSLDFSPITLAERKKSLPVGFFKMTRTHT